MLIISVGTSLYDNCNAKWGVESPDDLFDYLMAQNWAACNELKALKQMALSKGMAVYLLFPDVAPKSECAIAIENFIRQEGYLVFSQKLPNSPYNSPARLVSYLHFITELLSKAGSKIHSVISLDRDQQITLALMLSAITLGKTYYLHDEYRDSLVRTPELPIGYDIPLYEQWRECIDSIAGSNPKTLKESILPDPLHHLFVSVKGRGLVLSPIGEAIVASSKVKTFSDVAISNVKSHATLFGPGAASRLSDIHSEPFKKLCGMLKRLYPGITEFVFDAFDFHTKDLTGFAEFFDYGRGWLRYRLTLPEGRQIIKAKVPLEQEKRARAAIGSLIRL